MDCDKIILQLTKLSSVTYKSNVAKLGIPVEHARGVSTGDLRFFAMTLKKSSERAFELWNTSYHEAKILVVLLFDKKTLPLTAILPLMDVYSWDLCDHLCKNLIVQKNMSAEAGHVVTSLSTILLIPIMYAVIVTSILPVLIAYPYVQNFFKKGVALSTVMG